MKLGKLMMIEASIAVLVLSIAIAAVELTPYLDSSNQNASIGLYHSRDFGKGIITIERGERMRGVSFNYSTYDPAILSIDITTQTCQTPGTLNVACNGKIFAKVAITSENPRIILTAITFSGAEWVEPYYIYSRTIGNEISFTSEREEGFEGTFTYQINIRGSR